MRGRRTANKETPPPQMKAIGRYRVERVLGEGGFGRVYLAQDDQLNRPVAIKVPRRPQLLQPCRSGRCTTFGTDRLDPAGPVR
jgi:serine/threonine protein kinase